MANLALGASDVHLWWIDLARCRRGASTLSLAERQRAARLRRADDRRRWIVSRAALRDILAGYVGVAPHELSLAVGTHGKPALAGGAPRFSLSHSGKRALLAVSLCAVGVDLEPVAGRGAAPAELAVLVEKVCSVEEAARVLALPEGDRRLAFLRLWVLKESYLKGIGVGLGREPKTVEVGLLKVAGAPGWTLRLLDAGAGWVGALAVSAAEPSITELHWP